MKKLLVLLAAAATLFAADSLTQARQELERLRGLVDAGLLAPAKLADAQRAVDDASDEAVLDRTLYGHIEIEDLSERQTAQMVEAAQRRLDRELQQSAHARQLIAEYGAPPGDFVDIEAEVGRRAQVLDQAKARATLLLIIVEAARAEVRVAEDSLPGVWKAREFVDGDHLLEPKDVKALTLAFEKHFDKPMPVSARGSTAVHRALGFDHTGRIDVAVTPDSPEGVWLRKYLKAKAIPYYAFRIAIAGKATGAHIHIGPGSTRLQDATEPRTPVTGLQ